MNKKSASASMQKRFFYSLPASDSDRSFSTAAGSSADPPYPSSPAQSPATAFLCLPG